MSTPRAPEYFEVADQLLAAISPDKVTLHDVRTQQQTELKHPNSAACLSLDEKTFALISPGRIEVRDNTHPFDVKAAHELFPESKRMTVSSVHFVPESQSIIGLVRVPRQKPQLWSFNLEQRVLILDESPVDQEFVLFGKKLLFTDGTLVSEEKIERLTLAKPAAHIVASPGIAFFAATHPSVDEVCLYEIRDDKAILTQTLAHASSPAWYQSGYLVYRQKNDLFAFNPGNRFDVGCCEKSFLRCHFVPGKNRAYRVYDDLITSCLLFDLPELENPPVVEEFFEKEVKPFLAAQRKNFPQELAYARYYFAIALVRDIGSIPGLTVNNLRDYIQARFTPILRKDIVARKFADRFFLAVTRNRIMFTENMEVNIKWEMTRICVTRDGGIFSIRNILHSQPSSCVYSNPFQGITEWQPIKFDFVTRLDNAESVFFISASTCIILEIFSYSDRFRGDTRRCSIYTLQPKSNEFKLQHEDDVMLPPYSDLENVKYIAEQQKVVFTFNTFRGERPQTLVHLEKQWLPKTTLSCLDVDLFAHTMPFSSRLRSNHYHTARNVSYTPTSTYSATFKKLFFGAEFIKAAIKNITQLSSPLIKIIIDFLLENHGKPIFVPWLFLSPESTTAVCQSYMSCDNDEERNLLREVMDCLNESNDLRSVDDEKLQKAMPSYLLSQIKKEVAANADRNPYALSYHIHHLFSVSHDAGDTKREPSSRAANR